MKVTLLSLTALLFSLTLQAKQQPPVVSSSKPNILWIITDDHRPDSIAYYNQAMTGKAESALGYVESPHADKLAAEGVLFTHANCNAPACGPSRGSMHSGRYPFRNGHYAFELSHQEPDFVRPAIAQTLRDSGYQTASFGKDDPYIYKWEPGKSYVDPGFFDYRVHFKHDLQKNGFGDLFTAVAYEGGVNGISETLLRLDGSKETHFLRRNGQELTPEDHAKRKAFNEEFDLLRSYTRSNPHLIIGGENPRPAQETVDAYIVDEFVRYLKNADQPLTTMWGKKTKGADTSKPVFLHLGFHLPHTPVLPPKTYRDRFKTKAYTLPKFDKEELSKQPEQLKRLYNAMKWEGMTEEEKQTAVQDYYAFCAHGDTLIGEAVEAFKEYCKQNNQEYLIVFTIGDHGWHLGEQGITAKFGPWKQSVANATIMVSSDKSKIAPGTFYRDFIEFVDFAPTFMHAAGIDYHAAEFEYLDGFSLFDVLDGKKPKREYVLGEMSLVVGHRAYLHTDRFRFSMKTRPFNGAINPENMGQDVDWALNAPLKDVDLALYDLEADPDERNNVAYQEEYRALAEWFRTKLANIVLGDGRVECDWSQANSFHLSNFAEGADDKKADIPAELIH